MKLTVQRILVPTIKCVVLHFHSPHPMLLNGVHTDKCTLIINIRLKVIQLTRMYGNDIYPITVSSSFRYLL